MQLLRGYNDDLRATYWE